MLCESLVAGRRNRKSKIKLRWIPWIERLVGNRELLAFCNHAASALPCCAAETPHSSARLQRQRPKEDIKTGGAVKGATLKVAGLELELPAVGANGTAYYLLMCLEGVGLSLIYPLPACPTDLSNALLLGLTVLTSLRLSCCCRSFALSSCVYSVL